MLDEPLPPVFTSRQAELRGIPRGQLRQWLGTGRVRRMLRDVYADSALADSMDLRLQALALVVTPEHIACDRTAAWLLGVDARSMGESPSRIRPEVCVRRNEIPTERPELRSRTRDLDARDVMRMGGVALTTPVRTALDVGCNLRRSSALAVMDELSRRYGFDADSLAFELPRFRRRRGVIQLRQLVPLIDPRAESPRESWTRLAIHDAGLPPPVSQWEVLLGGRVVRLDFAYPERLVAVEYDGADFHDSQEARIHDRERRAALARAGWRVIVVRRDGLHGAGKERWLRDLRVELQRDPIMLRW